MIWDAFMFRDELDMLQCRLEEFGDRDVTHVLVEAPVTHQGQPKPLHYAENRERFAPWNDRIVHLVAEDLPTVEQNPDPWSRENAQRNFAAPHIAARAAPGDVVMLADVDEIPSQAALDAMPVPRHTLVMGILGFAADWVSPLRHTTTVCLLACNIDAPYHVLRNERDQWAKFYDGGWHISWLGGPDAIAAKAAAFCHLELKDMIEQMNARDELYGQGWTWFHNEEMTPVEQLESWPRYIREGRCPPQWFRHRRTA